MTTGAPQESAGEPARRPWVPPTVTEIFRGDAGKARSNVAGPPTSPPGRSGAIGPTRRIGGRFMGLTEMTNTTGAA